MMFVFRRRPLFIVTSSLALMSLLSASMCSQEGNENELLVAFVDNYVDSYLSPQSEALVSTATALATSAAQCEGVTQAVFLETEATAVEASFRSTWETWGTLALPRFGPFDQTPLRIEPKMDGGPVDTGAVDSAIVDGNTAEQMRDIGANRRGLPAVGYVLFDVMRRPELSNEDFVAACTYLQAATVDVTFLAEQWHEGFLGDGDGWALNLTDPDGSEEVDGDIDALTLLLQNTGDALYIAREDGIVAPRGDAPEGDLNLPALLARPSGLTLVRLDAVVRASEALIRGDGTERVTAETLYATRRETAATDIAAAFDAYWSARGAIDGTLEDALTTDLSAVNALNDALRGLSTLVLGDIMGGLGLAVSFTDADGD